MFNKKQIMLVAQAWPIPKLTHFTDLIADLIADLKAIGMDGLSAVFCSTITLAVLKPSMEWIGRSFHVEKKWFDLYLPLCSRQLTQFQMRQIIKS